MLVRFNSSLPVFKGNATAAQVNAAQDIVAHTLQELRYVIGRRADFQVPNGNSFEVVPREITCLVRKDRALILRDLYSQAGKLMRRIELFSMANEQRVSLTELKMPLSANEQMALKTVRKKLDFVIALNRAAITNRRPF